jgi:small-conductance mechanosensitive channel
MPLPLSTDAEHVRELILQAFADHEDVLDAPAPNVFLDGIEGGHLIFNAKGYVSSPRAAYGVRSALLFTVLKRLHDAGLEVSSPPTMLLAPAPQPPAAQAAAPAAVPPPAAP